MRPTTHPYPVRFNISQRGSHKVRCSDQLDSISEIGSTDEHRQGWVYEREVEVFRLQKENADIREVPGIAPGGIGYTDHERAEYGQGRSIFGEENADTLNGRCMLNEIASSRVPATNLVLV